MSPLLEAYAQSKMLKRLPPKDLTHPVATARVADNNSLSSGLLLLPVPLVISFCGKGGKGRPLSPFRTKPAARLSRASLGVAVEELEDSPEPWPALYRSFRCGRISASMPSKAAFSRSEKAVDSSPPS